METGFQWTATAPANTASYQKHTKHMLRSQHFDFDLATVPIVLTPLLRAEYTFVTWSVNTQGAHGDARDIP
jgi:hypothetical protein